MQNFQEATPVQKDRGSILNERDESEYLKIAVVMHEITKGMRRGRLGKWHLFGRGRFHGVGFDRERISY